MMGCMRCLLGTIEPLMRLGVSELASLSSDLCHDRCACMAGHPQKSLIINKNSFVLAEGSSHGGLFYLARVLPSPFVSCSRFDYHSLISQITQNISTHYHSLN
ncbi:hypothetical protein BRARA_A00205 [Brassica rapa]|uniref:Uncharacterized protein n=1 Tax=Brassica campestris TaxID=3711 RepID=A0A398AJX2_BRACM|nr:hypothetical protein BRARA_A00205 [Brassica rapa]